VKTKFNFTAVAAVCAAIPPARLRSLADLAPGEAGVISSLVDGSGPIGHRLQDLGLLPGTPVCVVRRAPLGDPIEFELRGYRLCLRRREAALVMVRSEA
jgi:ferrous iron transport protein A